MTESLRVVVSGTDADLPLELSAGDSASEDLPVEYQSEIVPSAEVEPGAGADMHLTKINVEERAAPADAAAAQLGPRGSFWWVVGVIVVAGVILAVIL